MTNPDSPKLQPGEVSGRILTIGGTYTVILDTSNPTAQSRDGQRFAQSVYALGNKPQNKLLAELFRALANSIEEQWE